MKQIPMRLETRHLSVKDTEAGVRLDQFLTKRFVRFSRSEWQKRLAAGEIKIAGQAARASRRLNAGDTIEFTYSMRDEPEVPTEIPIIFEDDSYLAVDKPAGLPVHPSGIYKERTVTTLLAQRGTLKEPYLLHRIDRETSGVLVLAKNRKAAAAFQKVLRAGKIDKDYLVAVEGDYAGPLDAHGFIYRRTNSRLPRQRFFTEGNPPADALEAQPCRTVFSVVKKQKGDLTLLQARLFTGRMHQIRATLASLGYPVVGDKLYGVDADAYFRFADEEMTEHDWRRLRIARSALHAAQLSLTHPLQLTPWQIEAPLPVEIAGLF
ncbi:MAG: RluA family pseudouridine synthase [Spirochaetes bacterium]|nr:RluA family pseudouridine synthase [Spirochaetota bacterium]